jgi:hypothetical protein
VTYDYKIRFILQAGETRDSAGGETMLVSVLLGTSESG